MPIFSLINITEPDPIKYGQNLHMSFSPHSKNMSDWANIINGKDGWFDEVENMDCANVIKFRYYQYAKSLTSLIKKTF